VFAPFADRTPATNVGILLLDLGGAALGDQRTEIALKSTERDQVAVSLWQMLACCDLCADTRGIGNSKPHTKSLLRKSPTSPVVDGPPMFMNTIAVGPFFPVAFCVTGGTTAA